MSSGYRAVPRQERSNKSIDGILDAAAELAAVVGLEQLTTVQVAKAAGVSVGRLYYWFEDKDALVEAVRTRGHENFEAFLKDSLQDLDIDDTSTLVKTYVRRFLEYVEKSPAVIQLFDREASSDQPEPNPFRVLMSDLVERLLITRVAGIGEAERKFVAKVLIAMMVAMASELLDGPPEEREALADEAVYVIYAYLHVRYPGIADQVWTNPDYPVRPSRAIQRDRIASPVYPAEI